MSSSANAKLGKSSLPNGFYDTLPPEAECKAQVVDSIMSVFSGYGYDRVSPALVEY